MLMPIVVLIIASEICVKMELLAHLVEAAAPLTQTAVPTRASKHTVNQGTDVQ